jgi:PAS domain S-box-containing protein
MLKTEELKLRRVIENMPSAFAYQQVIYDQQGRPVDYVFLDVNSLFEKYSGLDRMEVIGKRAAEIFPLTGEGSFDWIGAFTAAVAGGQTLRFDHYHAEHKKWYEFTAYSESKGYLVTFFRDISERKHKEAAALTSREYLKKILQTSVDGFGVFDTSGRIIEVNEAYCDMIGYTRAELRSKNITDLIVGEEPQETKAMIRQVMHAGSQIFESCHRRKSGSTVDVEVSVSHLKHDKDRFIAFIRDISSRRAAEEMLQKAHIALDEKVKERTAALEKTNLDLLAEIQAREASEIILKHNLDLQTIIANIKSRLLMIDSDELDREITSVLEELGRYFKVDRAYLFLLDDDLKTMHNSHEWCAEGIDSQLGSLQNVKTNIVPWKMKKLFAFDAINIPNINKMPPEAQKDQRVFQFLKLKSLLALPLIAHQRLIGFIGFDSVKKYRKWHEDQVYLLTVVSGSLSSAMLRRDYETAIATEKERLKVTLRSISEGLIVCDVAENVLFINDAAAKITGWSVEEAEGMIIKDLLVLSEKSSSTITDDPLGLIVKKEALIDYMNPLLLTTRGGKKTAITARCAMVKNGSVTEESFVIVFDDISAQIAAATRLGITRKLEAIGLLASGIAHEMNTPIQYVSDNLSFIKKSFEDIISALGFLLDLLVNPDDKDFLAAREKLVFVREQFDFNYYLKEIPVAIDQTREGISRVNKIIAAMKNYSHHSSGEMLEINLNEAIEDAVTLTRNEWKYVSDLKLELDKTMPPLACEGSAVNQVLVNLIVNAAQAIRDEVENERYENGLILIRSRVEEDYAVIEVEDNGIGIAKANLESVFNPFFTTRAYGQGSGQGLMIVQDIVVNKHRGSVEVESGQGKGTCFTVKLPLDQAQP